MTDSTIFRVTHGSSSIHDEDGNVSKVKKDIDGKYGLKTVSFETSSHKLAQLKEMEMRGVDITTEPLLVNNRNIAITLNNGELIYTE